MAYKYDSMDPFSSKGAGWGYWKIDFNYQGGDFRSASECLPPESIKDMSATYFLNGCNPETYFQPGKEPEGFKFFWADNSMMPWLRYVSPANKNGHKLWSRVTYCTWGMNPKSPVDINHRNRVNNKLKKESDGVINDISDLWGGVTQGTVKPKKWKALVVPSSEKNHNYVYNETSGSWLDKVTSQLKKMGISYVVRNKVLDPSQRVYNQVSDQYVQEECDLMITQHSAASSEVVVLGAPIVTTSVHNPARDVSTKWKDFVNGELKIYDKKEIEDWVTRICGYTYYRDEINTLKFINYHPDVKMMLQHHHDVGELSIKL